jgi:predicted enzyme related to lactoylglutathione lyase
VAWAGLSNPSHVPDLAVLAQVHVNARLAGLRARAENDFAMSTNILCWTDIPVTDLKRAADFYTKVLGADVTVMKMEGWEFALLPHAQDNVSGCLAPADNDNQPSRQGPLVYLSVNGRLDAAVKAAADDGGEVLRPKHQIGPYGYRAIIVDSEGNRIALHSQTA